MSEHPAEENAEAIKDVTYDCLTCRWCPPGEEFCGTCIRKILKDIELSKLIYGGKNGGNDNEQGSIEGA